MKEKTVSLVSKMRSTKYILKYRNGFVLFTTLIAIVILFFLAYGWLHPGQNWAGWTGFGEYVPELSNNGLEINKGKTLWDWLELLIVPASLSGLALWFNWVTRKSEKVKEENKFQEDTLQAYLDYISKLLSQHNLLNSADDTTKGLARAHTLIALRNLNGTRKGLLLQFIDEAGLISKDKPIINLRNADLTSIDLTDVFLGTVNLDSAKMQKSNLSNQWIIGASMAYTDLSGSDLSNTVISESQMWKAKLEGANLSKTSFMDVNLHDTDLSKTNLRGEGIIRCDLRGANLQGLNLDKTVWFKTLIDDKTKIDLKYRLLWKLYNNALDEIDIKLFVGADFRQAKLPNVRLRNANLQSIDFRNADLENADFSNSDLTDANLSDANLSSANLENANLTSALLKGAKLTSANLKGAKLVKSILDEADLSGNEPTPFSFPLIGIPLSTKGADLSDADLSFASLKKSKLRHAQLIRANLYEGKLNKADLTMANLSEANLERADMSRSILVGTIFHKTILRKANLRNTFFGDKSQILASMATKLRLLDIDLSETIISRRELKKWSKLKMSFQKAIEENASKPTNTG